MARWVGEGPISGDFGNGGQNGGARRFCRNFFLLLVWGGGHAGTVWDHGRGATAGAAKCSRDWGVAGKTGVGWSSRRKRRYEPTWCGSWLVAHPRLATAPGKRSCAKPARRVEEALETKTHRAAVRHPPLTTHMYAFRFTSNYYDIGSWTFQTLAQRRLIQRGINDQLAHARK